MSSGTASTSYAFSLYPGAGTTTSRASSPPAASHYEIDPSLATATASSSTQGDLTHDAAAVPRAVPDVELGRTRCYWCILSPSLDFVFVDPILHTHLAEETPKFMGSNLLDYVHPDEVASLKADLVSGGGVGTGGVESGGVFGSVTRCRYSRVSRIRKLLGCSSPPVAPNASQFVYDSDYLELQITTSWIGGPTSSRDKARGAVLAFFHATADIDASQDNNEETRNSWTNWCGPNLKDGSYLDPIRCQQLLDTLMHVTGTASPRSSPDLGDSEDDDGPPPHVFQILDHTGEAIVSFPSESSKPYDRREYSTLAREVVARRRDNVDAKTSCTRRYRSKHPIMKNGTLTTIQSVIILYGSISFCVFQTGGVFLPKSNPMPTPASTPSLAGIAGFGANNFELEDVKPTSAPSAKRELDDEGDSSTVIKRQRRKKSTTGGPTLGGAGSFPSTGLPLSIATSQPLHYTPSLADHASTTSGALSPTVASASAILGSFSSTSSQHEQYDYNRLPSANQGVSAYHLQPQHRLHSPSSSGYQLHPLHQTYPPYDVPGQTYSSHDPPTAPQPSQSYSSADFGAPGSKLPPLRPAAHGSTEPASPNSVSATPPKPRAKAEPVIKTGAKACESCGTINSPEWRKGPGGVKSLCNACGLRYARSVARQTKLANGDASPSGAAPGKKGKQSLAAASEKAKSALAASQNSSTGSPRPLQSSQSPAPTSTNLPSPRPQSQTNGNGQPSYDYKPPSLSAGPPRAYSSYQPPMYPTGSHQQPAYSQASYSMGMSQASYSSVPAYASSDYANGNGNSGGGEGGGGVPFGEPSPAARQGSWNFPPTSASNSGAGQTQPWSSEGWRGLPHGG